MNKKRFRLLVFLMSLSLIGIIVVRLYWISSSLDQSEEQFKFHVQQVIGNVAEKINSEELKSFIVEVNKIKDSTGRTPDSNVLKEIFFYEKDTKTNETIMDSYTYYIHYKSQNIDCNNGSIKIDYENKDNKQNFYNKLVKIDNLVSYLTNHQLNLNENKLKLMSFIK